MHKIIIDTDPGIDDAQAIAYAIAHPEIDLIGLTTVFGNASVDITTRNALTILDTFSRADIPVAAGASQPLHQVRLPSPDFVHGTDGLGNLNLPKPDQNPIQESAAEFIIRSVNEQPGAVSIVAIGPLTNIARAVQLDPELPSNVRELIIMGGTVSKPGNVTPVAEANFINDPHAADEVLAYDWSTKIVGLDVTLEIHLREQDLMTIRDKQKLMGPLLWNSGQYYLDFYTRSLSTTHTERACAMHDASAVICVTDPDAFEFTRGPARAVATGIAVGQLIMDIKNETNVVPHWQGRPTVSAAIKVDAKRVRNTFVETITTYEP